MSEPIRFQDLVAQLARDLDPEAFAEIPASAPPVIHQQAFIARAKARCAIVREFCRAPIAAPEPPVVTKGRRHPR